MTGIPKLKRDIVSVAGNALVDTRNLIRGDYTSAIRFERLLYLDICWVGVHHFKCVPDPSDPQVKLYFAMSGLMRFYPFDVHPGYRHQLGLPSLWPPIRRVKVVEEPFEG